MHPKPPVRKLLLPFLLLSIALFSSAEPLTSDSRVAARVPSAISLELLMDDLSARPLGQWSGAEQVTVWKLREAIQEEVSYVTRSALLSAVMPGFGQFLNGDIRSGMSDFLSDMLLASATIVLATAVLPPAVRPDNLSYLGTTFLQIENKWEQVTPAELIPSLATLLIGGAAGVALRFASASRAEELAIWNLNSGAIEWDQRRDSH